MTARTYLVFGLLAGLCAGIVAFGVAFTVGEPAVDQAIAFEESQATAEHSGHDHEHADEAAAITRGEQSTAGLATATLAIGVVLGGMAGIAAAFLTGRLGRLTPVGAGALAAGLGFLSFTLIPFVLHPPNPPAVGDPDTIATRTAAYFALVVVSIVASVAAVLVARALLHRGAWLATVAGGAVVLGYVLVATFLVPEPTIAPEGFPANTLYDFRLGSLLTQAALWLTIGVVLSGLLARVWAKEKDAIARRELAASL